MVEESRIAAAKVKSVGLYNLAPGSSHQGRPNRLHTSDMEANWPIGLVGKSTRDPGYNVDSLLLNPTNLVYCLDSHTFIAALAGDTR